MIISTLKLIQKVVTDGLKTETQQGCEEALIYIKSIIDKLLAEVKGW